MFFIHFTSVFGLTSEEELPGSPADFGRIQFSSFGGLLDDAESEVLARYVLVCQQYREWSVIGVKGFIDAIKFDIESSERPDDTPQWVSERFPPGAFDRSNNPTSQFKNNSLGVEIALRRLESAGLIVMKASMYGAKMFWLTPAGFDVIVVRREASANS